MFSETSIKAYLRCRVIQIFATHHKSILVVSPRLGYMVMHLDVGVRKWITLGKIDQVGMRRGFLNCTPRTEKTGLPALMPCHLNDGPVLVGTAIQSLDATVFQLTLDHKIFITRQTSPE